ncbi:MAG TPA: NAD(P)/FAD-dependent oxidoreductase, partial [Thermoanaerobaculia bacterium]|nr:NAD(P)/FAD-dependent oxidoreductase [Thermoanaerobaculia bacterium]
ATLTAQQGHRVLLLERARYPRFKIGESLMPATYWTLERMGVLQKIKDSRFVRKYSVQFYTRTGKGSAPFYFQETDPHESSVTWQVLRSEFDALLLEHAAEQGVEVRRGANVKDVLFEGERAVGVQAEFEGEGTLDLSCRVVVDATGQTALISRKLGLRQPDPELKKASFFTHFEGAYRDPGIDEGATLVLHTETADAWFWYIPLPDDRVSVGVVGSPEYLLAGRQGDPQALFEQEVARCPALKPRLEGARQLFPVQATRDFSYRSSRVAGDGWVLVGDAFGFLDPIYSSGVFLALKSGEMAADAIHDALTADDVSAARLGAFGPGFAEGMESMRKLVYAFYEKDFSFAQFLGQFPEHRLELIHLLVGNVFREGAMDQLFADMSQMCRLPEAAPLKAAEAGAAAVAAPGH